MTIPQYRELAAYWRKFPPSHLLLRRLFGAEERPAPAADLGTLLAQAGQHGLLRG